MRVQWSRALLTKSDNLSSVPRIYIVDVEKLWSQTVLCLLHVHHGTQKHSQSMNQPISQLMNIKKCFKRITEKQVVLKDLQLTYPIVQLRRLSIS